jgi:hypothetical protein
MIYPAYGLSAVGFYFENDFDKRIANAIFSLLVFFQYQRLFTFESQSSRQVSALITASE